MMRLSFTGRKINGFPPPFMGLYKIGIGPVEEGKRIDPVIPGEIDVVVFPVEKNDVPGMVFPAPACDVITGNPAFRHQQLERLCISGTDGSFVYQYAVRTLTVIRF